MFFTKISLVVSLLSFLRPTQRFFNTSLLIIRYNEFSPFWDVKDVFVNQHPSIKFLRLLLLLVNMLEKISQFLFIRAAESILSINDKYFESALSFFICLSAFKVSTQFSQFLIGITLESQSVSYLFLKFV